MISSTFSSRPASSDAAEAGPISAAGVTPNASAKSRILLSGRSTSPFSIFAMEERSVYPVRRASSSCDIPAAVRYFLMF